jgi:toxin ParE1/3/4
MKLTLTEAALEDLGSIRAYTLETWGGEQEETYLRKIWSRIQTLLEDPLRYRLREELFPGCRIASEGRHVILFQSENESLTIVRVLHSAMDFKRHILDR